MSSKCNKKRSAAGLRPDPIEVQTILDVIRAVDVAASRPWTKHPDSTAAVDVLCGDDERKWMWKLDGINGKGKG